MATLPTLPNIPVGYVVQDSDLNNAAACVSFLMSKPYARVHSATAGTALGTGGAYTAMAWDTVDQDGDSMWASGTPTRLTVKTPGFWKIRYSIVTTSTSNVNMTYVKATTGNNNPNGPGNVFGPFWGSDGTGSTGGSKGIGSSGLWPYYMYVGDYFEVFATSSAADAMDTASSTPSFFSAEFISMEVS